MARPSASSREELARLIVLAWPVALAQLGSMLMGLVDVVMVGQLGEAPLAAVSLGHTYAFAITLPAFGFALGLDPLFAQAFGAGRPERARQTAWRAAAVLGLAVLPMALLHVFAGPVLIALGQPADLAEGAAAYVWVRGLAILPFVGFALFRQLLQAAGRMWPGTLAIVVGNVVNVIVNGVLVYGLMGFPRLEGVGAAWATVASTGLMFLTLALVGLLAPTPRDHAIADVAESHRPPVSWWRILAVAGPVGLQVAFEGWGFSVSTLLVGTFGETALAAHTVALMLASTAFMVPLGISSAAATRVGNLLGAGHAWGRSAWLSVGLGAGVMACFASLFLLFPRWLAMPFVDSPSAVELAAWLLPVAAGFALFDGVQVVTFGVLRGAGDTTVPAIANIVGYYLVGLPLGALLAYGLGLGAIGVWVGLAAALATVSGLLLLRLSSTLRRGGFAVG